MKRTYKYLTALLILAMAAGGCSKDPSTAPRGNVITFGVRMAEETEATETKAASQAGQYTASSLAELDEFTVTGFDDSDKIIDNGKVCKMGTGPTWQLEKNPKVWVDGHTMTFWASANLPSSGVSATLESIESAGLNVTEIPSDATDQFDPLVGYYSGSGEKGKATITFYHPMTAVRFVTGSLGSPQKVASINSVTIQGVHKQGTATIKAVPSIPTITWAPSGKTNVSGSFSGTGTEGKSAVPFLIIPQNLSDDHVTIKVNVDLVEGGTTDMTAMLETDEWKAGFIYTYTLDYVVVSPMDMTLTVTLADWQILTNKNGGEFFDVTFGTKPTS